MSARRVPVSHSFARARRTISLAPTLCLAFCLAFVLTMVSPGVARAHTGFGSSTPSDGAVVDEPVGLITIVFTGEANPVGEKFVALTPDGIVQQPAGIDTVDNEIFSIRFDPPLAGGQVGLRWSVQAADAHPIEGAFSFTVTAPAATTAPATTVPATTVPATTVPATTEPTVEVTATEVPVAQGAQPTTPLDDDDAAVVIEDEQFAPPSADAETAAADDAAIAQPQSLDEFLTVDNSAPGQTTATVGRLIGFLGVILGLGALAFAAMAMRGRRHEIRRVLAGVRVLGVVVVVGAAVEYVGVARMGSESIASGWSTAPGFATVLRVVGGIGLAFGVAATIVRVSTRRPSSVRSLSAAVIDNVRADESGSAGDGPIVRWVPDRRSWPAAVGAMSIIASFWFDGHTVSKGFRPLHALVNSVHVAAGAIWVGGVVTIAAVVWARFRSHEPMRVADLVIRFSKIATISLAAVVIAGGVMALLVLDSFGDLTGTTWGQVLLLKTGGVGLAMIGGAYNHFRLLPALESDPESPRLLVDLRNTLTAEAIMLIFVVTVTAWLVAAAT